MNKMILSLAILAFISIIILLCLPKKELTEEQKVKAWRPRDFYLVYQYYFNPNFIELRKEIEHNEMVRNQEVGQGKRL
tara:strand:+ start:322 stop:555 length:234 start_codon:yes stop_codon:yes gene_type:complete